MMSPRNKVAPGHVQNFGNGNPQPHVMAKARAHAARMKKLRARLAREDANTFVGYVLRDEQSNKPITQAPTHEAWHDLINKHDRLIIWSHVEGGKTQQIAVGRVLWELGRNPNLRVGILSNTIGQSKKIVRQIARYVESSDALHEVFPGLRPASGETWNDTMLQVQREVQSKDPSVQAIGVHGSIEGTRIDLLIVDDILDQENTSTPGQMQSLSDWFFATPMGRQSDRFRCVIIGNAWHPSDLLHQLARAPNWKPVRYPVVDEQTGELRWPQKWPAARIAKAREDWASKPGEFARKMLCIARDDTQARFKASSIDKCKRNGDGLYLLNRVEGLESEFQPHIRDGDLGGARIFTGVDLAIAKHSAADMTSMFTIIVAPDGRRRILAIESGRWGGPEIVNRIIDAHKRFRSIVIVENNAAQDFIYQFVVDRSAIPIKPFTTGRNKAHHEFGIESLAVEMENAKWVIPNEGGRCHPEVEAWIQEMLYYDPAKHTGDRLMASWFAREGIRMGGGKEGVKVQAGNVDVMSR